MLIIVKYFAIALPDCLRYKDFVKSTFCSIHFIVVLARLKKVVCYTEDFVIERFHCGVKRDLNSTLVPRFTFRRREPWVDPGYFRVPGFNQNTVRDSGKRKLSWRETGCDCYEGSRIHQNLGTGCGIFCFAVGNSRNHDDSSTCPSGKWDSTTRAYSWVCSL